MDLPNLQPAPSGVKKLTARIVKGWQYFTSFRFYKVKNSWKRLNFAQRCYVGATLLLIIFDAFDAGNVIGFGIPVIPFWKINWSGWPMFCCTFS